MSEVLKKIGDYTITDSDVLAFIANLPQQQQMYKDIPEFREQILERLEEITLFALEAEATKVTETEEYLEALKIAKRDIGSQLALRNVLTQASVSDEEAQEYFNGHKSAFAKGPSASAKHILVDSEEKANDIKKKIESGDKSFEDAAKEYSSCPSSQKGGSLGTFGRGQMVKEFDQAVFEGEVQTILGPVQTQFGYHLIFIDERNDGETPEFDAVKDRVKSELMKSKQQKLYDEKLEELRKKYITE